MSTHQQHKVPRCGDSAKGGDTAVLIIWNGRAEMTVEQRRPHARTWLLAAVELAAAILVARLIGWTVQNPASAPVGDHAMSGMPGMAVAPAAHWGWMEYTAIGVAAAALAWWLLLRQPVAAVPAAGGGAAGGG